MTVHDEWLVPGQVNDIKEVIPARLDIGLVTHAGDTPPHLNGAIVDGLQAPGNLTLTAATIAIYIEKYEIIES